MTAAVIPSGTIFGPVVPSTWHQVRATIINAPTVDGMTPTFISVVYTRHGTKDTWRIAKIELANNSGRVPEERIYTVANGLPEEIVGFLVENQPKNGA